MGCLVYRLSDLYTVYLTGIYFISQVVCLDVYSE